MWFFKSKELETKVCSDKTLVKLNVYFKEHRDWAGVQWTIGNYMNYMRIKGIKDFYKWYFGRPQSPYFRMKYDKGEHLIIRENINYIRIDISEGVLQ